MSGTGGTGGTVGVISPWLAMQMLNHAFSVAPMTQPLELLVGMFTSTVGNGTEVAASGYARQIVTFAAAGGTPVVTLNAADLQWLPASATWGNLVAAGIFNGAGDFYGWGKLLAPDGTPTTITVARGDILKIDAGFLAVGLT